MLAAPNKFITKGLNSEETEETELQGIRIITFHRSLFQNTVV